MKNYPVCVDASLAVLWLLPFQQTAEASLLLARWDKEQADLIGPPLFNAEVTSALRFNVYNKRLTPDEGEKAFAGFLDLAIKTINHPELPGKAWELAVKYNQPRTYDMQYLALAELEDCEFWTADMRLVHSLQGRNRRIRWVGEYEKP